jgi:N-acyl-D-aspartate/D-glutamate deacylase
VAPGFIDIHTHSDFTLPVRPNAEAKLLQGVTTDCTGNCGFSPFPLSDGAADRAHGAFFEPNLTQRWPTFDAYADHLESEGLGINIAPLVGLGAIRLHVLGDHAEPATDAALDEMMGLLRNALQAGAFGASSGLVYAPSSFAGVEELAALAAVVAEHGRLYATHMRNEGDRLLASLDEAFEVGRRSSCSIQISHLKALHRQNWGMVAEALRRIDMENAAGQDIWADVYPYTAGSTTLAALLPASVLSGGITGLRARLADAGQRAELEILVQTAGTFALEDVILATVPSRPELGGRWLTDAAAQDCVSPAELVLALIAENGVEASAVGHGMSEDDLECALGHPRVMVGSDGWTMAVDAASYAHPRSFGYAIRLLSRYGTNSDASGVSRAVSQLATIPAARLGLADRGQVKEGMVADLVVLDPERLDERSSFERPCVYPAGVEHVFVGGVSAVEDGELTGRRPGRVLRRT